jgi:proline iminopeptidase
MKHKVLVGGGLLVVLGVVLVLVLRRSMGRPLYTPGRLAAGEGLREPLDPPAAQGDASYFQVTPSVRLFHFEDGAGDDVLVLHGGPGVPPAKPWPMGEALTRQWRFIYFHQRGCGLSTRPIDRAPGGLSEAGTVHQALGLPAQIADVERIRRLLGRERLVLVGHSFGAFIAALYAAEFPERVAAIVAVAPANLAVLPSADADLYGWIEARLSGEERARFDTYRAARFDFRTIFQKSDDELVAMQAPFRDLYAAAAKMDRDRFPAAAKPGGWMPIASYVSMGRSHDWREVFARVKAPVLVVHGMDDLQPLAASQAFGAMFPRAEVTVVEGAGHFVFVDRPKELGTKVGAFLEKVHRRE